MRAIPAIIVAVSALVANSSARGCDDDRYLCEPKIEKPAAVAEPRAVAPRVVARSVPRADQVRRASEEKAPPDEPLARARIKIVSSWQPIDVPSQRVQPLPLADVSTDKRDVVRVVSADELNEIDVAALAAPLPEPARMAPVRVVWPEPPAPLRTPAVFATAPAPAPAPVDTSLLERVIVTFGGAFGAASALRVFLG